MSEKYQKFYDEYKNRLFSYLLYKSGDYEVSRDIMQESFTRHFQHYGHDAVMSPALLFTIARNAFVDHLRHQDRFQATEHIDAQTEADEERSLITKQESARINKALERLPELDREILSLAVNGVAYKDIATSCKLTEANVKVRIHRARVKLRQIMKNEVQ